MKYDLEDFYPIALVGIVLVFLVGMGVLVYSGESMKHETRMACIERGNQWISSNCIRSQN